MTKTGYTNHIRKLENAISVYLQNGIVSFVQDICSYRKTMDLCIVMIDVCPVHAR